MYSEILKLCRDGAPATAILMFVVLVFSCISLYSNSFFLKMILHPYSVIKEKEYYRLFTGDLVHNDFMHLILNEIMLYVMCASLEEHLKTLSHAGSWLFIIIYLSSCLFGSVLITVRHKKQFSYSSAGASGSILGCMFSFMILKPNYMGFYLPVLGGIKNTYTALIYIVILIGYQKRSEKLLLNHELHFYSAVGGILATLVLFYDQI